MNIIWEDFIARGGNKSYLSLIKNVFLNPSFRLVFFYRISSYFYSKKSLKVLSTLMFNINHVIHGCEIKPSANIGRGLIIPHAVGLVVGESVVIGDNCRIYPNVTLGTDKAGTSNYPTIGNNVNIYVGASILGSINIGSNAQIGAHSLVLSDVPEGSLAVGIPAKVKEKRT